MESSLCRWPARGLVHSYVSNFVQNYGYSWGPWLNDFPGCERELLTFVGSKSSIFLLWSLLLPTVTLGTYDCNTKKLLHIGSNINSAYSFIRFCIMNDRKHSKQSSHHSARRRPLHSLYPHLLLCQYISTIIIIHRPG